MDTEKYKNSRAKGNRPSLKDQSVLQPLSSFFIFGDIY